MKCDMRCKAFGEMYRCRCTRCNQTIDAKRLPVHALCGAFVTGGRASATRPRDRPGAALKSILAAIGITATQNCSCNARAAEMDARGCDWCEENLDTIVGWLREEAEKRGLPFLDVAARLLIRRAIHNARKAAKRDKMD